MYAIGEGITVNTSRGNAVESLFSKATTLTNTSKCILSPKIHMNRTFSDINAGWLEEYILW